MKHPRHFIEDPVPAFQRDAPEGETGPMDSRPQIRRLLERLCKKLGYDFADVVQMQISYNRVLIVSYDRDADGHLYRDEFNKVATKNERIEVDTFTFLGDERDL